MFAAIATGVSTGGITVYNVITADEPFPELIEVPLMTMMVIATIWHVRSRQKAAAVVAALADERQRMIERERTFFANVTHDLMTPITIARGHVDILGRSGAASPEELAETKQVIVEELKRIESMVGDLLLVGRLDDSAAALHRQRIDAEEFLHIVADRWTVVAERAWTIDIDAPGTVLVDGNTLSQALDNVIENAVSCTMPGTPSPSVPAPSVPMLQGGGRRHGTRHPAVRSPPRLRPVLPRRPRPLPDDRRLRSRAGDRPRRGRGARRRGLDRVAARRRHAPDDRAAGVPARTRGGHGARGSRTTTRPEAPSSTFNL